MLSCQELVELITDYVEGALDERRHADVARHLSECDDCLEYVAQLQQTERVLAAMTAATLPAATLSAEDRAGLVATYRAWCARKSGPPVA